MFDDDSLGRSDNVVMVSRERNFLSSFIEDKHCT